MLRVIVALLTGALVGGLAAHYFWPGATAESCIPIDLPATQVVRAEPRAPVLEQPERSVAGAPGEREGAAVDPDVLITAALRRHAEEGLRAGWKATRKDEMPDEDLAEGMAKWEELVLGSAPGIGRSLAERRTKAEEALADAKTGGVFALLEKLDKGGVGPLPSFVRDPKQFEPLFQRMVGESRRHGTANRGHPDKSAEDGVTLTWPPGVFGLDGLMTEKDPYPRDVTLQGAGMDATMLVLRQDLMTNGALRNFAIRDCTLHTKDNYLFDLRVNPAAIRFDRVRFVGFDTGAGGSCLLGTRSLALWARNCRFEGGYGRAPEFGQIFDVRTDALVARFESCTLSLLSLHREWIRPGATVLFLGCTLDQILDDPLAYASTSPGVLFDNCSITRREGGYEDVPHLDLNALFPNWQQRME